MYTRIFNPPKKNSYFLFGPRGVGKSHFIRQFYPKALFFDLLNSDIYTSLLSSPYRLSSLIPSSYKGWVIIDEIQKIPELLNEVHRLIESRKKKIHFVLTGSSARKLKFKNTNLLAGRAFTQKMYPLTAQELGRDFNLKKSLLSGHLPLSYTTDDSTLFLKSYVKTYLQEEIQQESLTRNLPAFSRFLEAASFSQASILNTSSVARECSVDRKAVENYFSILRDTMLSFELKIFSKRAKRKLLKSNKFYFFDAGIYKTLRPEGPLDSTENILGSSLETLVLQELMAHNFYQNWNYEINYWHTQNHVEVDFILYGKRGFFAIEVKCSERIRKEDFKGIEQFLLDYPKAQGIFLYTGRRFFSRHNVKIIPVQNFLKNPSQFV